MAESFEIKEVPDVRAAVLPRHTDAPNVGRVVREGMAALMDAVASAGAVPAGSPYLVTKGEMDDPAGLDLEIGVPVRDPFPGIGDVVEGVLPGATVASTIHVGSYRTIGRAYDALTVWIAEQGREIAGPPVEFYISDPSQTPPEELRTEIRFPVR